MLMRLLSTFAAFLMLGVTALATPPVPRKAAEFDLAEPSGHHVLLSQYKGKVVIMQFLYTTCPHCQHLAGVLTQLQQKYGPRGLQVLGIAFNPEVDGNMAVVRNFVSDYHVGFPVGSAPRDTVISYLGISAVQRFVVPQIMVVDRRGEVQAQSDAMGTEQLQDPNYLSAMVEKLLKQPARRTSAVHHTTHRTTSHTVAAVKKAGE
jgi:peroxiredoxin